MADKTPTELLRATQDLNRFRNRAYLDMASALPGAFHDVKKGMPVHEAVKAHLSPRPTAVPVEVRADLAKELAKNWSAAKERLGKGLKEALTASDVDKLALDFTAKVIGHIAGTRADVYKAKSDALLGLQKHKDNYRLSNAVAGAGEGDIDTRLAGDIAAAFTPQGLAQQNSAVRSELMKKLVAQAGNINDLRATLIEADRQVKDQGGDSILDTLEAEAGVDAASTLIMQKVVGPMRAYLEETVYDLNVDMSEDQAEELMATITKGTGISAAEALHLFTQVRAKLKGEETPEALAASVQGMLEGTPGEGETHPLDRLANMLERMEEPNAPWSIQEARDQFFESPLWIEYVRDVMGKADPLAPTDPKIRREGLRGLRAKLREKARRDWEDAEAHGDGGTSTQGAAASTGAALLGGGEPTPKQITLKEVGESAENWDLVWDWPEGADLPAALLVRRKGSNSAKEFSFEGLSYAQVEAVVNQLPKELDIPFTQETVEQMRENVDGEPITPRIPGEEPAAEQPAKAPATEEAPAEATKPVPVPVPEKATVSMPRVAEKMAGLAATVQTKKKPLVPDLSSVVKDALAPKDRRKEPKKKKKVSTPGEEETATQEVARF